MKAAKLVALCCGVAAAFAACVATAAWAIAEHRDAARYRASLAVSRDLADNELLRIRAAAALTESESARSIGAAYEASGDERRTLRLHIQRHCAAGSLRDLKHHPSLRDVRAVGFRTIVCEGADGSIDRADL